MSAHSTTCTTNGHAAGNDHLAKKRGGDRTRGALLLNLGTPDEPTTRAVRRYLIEFLSDPEVIRLPPWMRWFNGPLARLIALFRAHRSAEAYRAIWTERGSPLKSITEDQVAALERAMPNGWRVFYAMRYGAPCVAAVLDEIVGAGIEDLVIIPMYPQFSGPTTGTAVDDLYRHLRKRGQRLNLTIRNSWHDDIGYIDAQARLIQQVAEREGLTPHDCVLLFSTHSMPESYIRGGDPYQQQVIRTVDLVRQRLGWPADRTRLAYQSKLGPVPWLSPSTEETLLQLADAGEDNVLVCPVSFTADCLETLEEIGMGYREQFESKGGRMHLCPSLNDFEPFIHALSQLALRGAKPVSDRGKALEPLMTFETRHDDRFEIDSLVMIGASLPPRLTDGDDPSNQHLTPHQFQCVKRPYAEVSDLLRAINTTGDFEECWLWNTCNRFEFYGRLTAEPRSSEADQALARAARAIIGEQVDELPHNVLAGRDAWHHLLRTAAGLNSGLPGDTEVVEQMDVARRLATRCGTAGAGTQRLVDEVRRRIDPLRDHTSWGRFSPEYCPVALKRIALRMTLSWRDARCVVIGGSATARSVLLALRNDFDVDSTKITAIHRKQCKGAQMKRIQRALGRGSMLRVETYEDPRVLDAILTADVVIFAIDARTPILAGEQLRRHRDFTRRPLTVVDFNTFGSTKGLPPIAGVRLIDAERLEKEVGHFADGLLECAAFSIARRQAETWLRHAAGLDGDTEMCTCSRLNGSHDGNGDADAWHCDGGPASAFRVCPCAREARQLTCPKRLMAERIES
jgi:ferrochelatase